MGTKFGNVHVRSGSLKEVTAALEEIASARVVPASRAAPVTGFEALIQQADRSKQIYYIADWGNGWISILNDFFGWGETESFGEELSGHLSSPVMTVSYFDDDVLEMNIYRNGELATGHRWCSAYAQADYELEDLYADISVLFEVMGHRHIEELMRMLELEDREQAVERLESIMELPVWIHSDWFSDISDDERVYSYKLYDFNSQ